MRPARSLIGVVAFSLAVHAVALAQGTTADIVGRGTDLIF